MVESCKNVGLPEPEYGTDGTFVWIIFKRPSLDTNLGTNLGENKNNSSNTNINIGLDNSFNINYDACLDTNLDTYSDSTQELSERQKEVLAYCMIPRSSRDILEHIGLANHTKNRDKFIINLVDKGLLNRTVPESPKSPLQKYVTVVG